MEKIMQSEYEKMHDHITLDHLSEMKKLPPGSVIPEKYTIEQIGKYDIYTIEGKSFRFRYGIFHGKSGVLYCLYKDSEFSPDFAQPSVWYAPPQKPEWLFIGVYTTCYVYADMRYEKNGDYKEICRLFYSPLRLEIMTTETEKYKSEIELAQIKLAEIKANIDKPIQISATGQTTKATL